jgi:hypothetical protein
MIAEGTLDIAVATFAEMFEVELPVMQFVAASRRVRDLLQLVDAVQPLDGIQDDSITPPRQP